MSSLENTAQATIENGDTAQAQWLDEQGDAPEQQYRASAYALLAGLLRCAPSQTILDQAGQFPSTESDDDDMTIAMSMLGLAARTSDPDMLAQEYHDLFIGLGRGELVPYGSWYLTGFLMEKPLGELRNDLSVLGYERDAEIKEPEDHIAALCEVMSLLIQDGRSLAEQGRFFSNHIAPWFERFFTDLGNAQAAVFYRAVARFGNAYLGLEQQYLSLGN
jgi:TorA maturation chaperone TorD